MDAKIKTKGQLINENDDLRQRVAELERLAIGNSSVQESLRKQQKEFQTIFDSVPIAIWYTDREGLIVRANQATALAFGLSVEDIVGKSLTELFPAREASKFIADLNEIINFEEPKIGVIEEYTLASGDKRLAQSDKIPYYGDTSDIIGMIVLTRDITEQEKTRDALYEGEEIFRLFMEHNPIYVFFKDENIRSVRLSRNYEKMLNMPMDQILGKTMDELFSSDLAKSMIEDDLRVLREEKLIEIEETFNGRHYTTTKFPILRTGKPPLLAGFTIDITKQKQYEKALKEGLERLRRLIGYIINVIGRAVELKDPYTSGHQKRVSNLARAIATEMSLSSEEIDCVRLAGSIHDLGKIAIPAELLSMPRKLTRVEFNLMKTHAQRGREILEGIEFPWPLADIIVQHHERLNGSGYPRRLKGNKILLQSRIIAIADVVEAIASHRPYRPALGIDIALAQIEKNKSVLYDPDASDACMRLFREKGFKL
ncbi:MAG: Cyclic di-GMP phosphodiesterase response regulator RpfG [Syntrophorhabdus sp. PtaU1.Bin153]|nr:MAG: Cyclic di-GMP phosphodiesterase response regulator RpfG [Syntrophorhabdus sp. PtaU1.Bin153]